MDTVIDGIQYLREKGFSCDFTIDRHGLHEEGSAICFGPSQVEVQHILRFEGKSNPADMAVVYGLKTDNGMKGVLIDAYGTYASEEQVDFITKIQKQLQ